MPRSSFYSGSSTNPLVRPTTQTVVTLVDAATVALDASLGSVFELSGAGSRTIDTPTNAPATGLTQKIILRLTASGAARTFSLTTGVSGSFRYGTDITTLTETASAKTDLIGAIWNEDAARWDVVAYVKGY